MIFRCLLVSQPFSRSNMEAAGLGDGWWDIRAILPPKVLTHGLV